MMTYHHHFFDEDDEDGEVNNQPMRVKKYADLSYDNDHSPV